MFAKVLFSAASLLATLNAVQLECPGNGGCGSCCDEKEPCEDPISAYLREVPILEVATKEATQAVDDWEIQYAQELTDDERAAKIDELVNEYFEALEAEAEEDPDFVDEMIHDEAEKDMAQDIVDNLDELADEADTAEEATQEAAEEAADEIEDAIEEAIEDATV